MDNDFPIKDRSKASKRRHNHLRKLEKAKEVGKKMYRYSSFNYSQEQIEHFIDTWARHHAENLAACSCDMCGNVRRHWKELTLAEKKNLVAYKEQLNMLDSDE